MSPLISPIHVGTINGRDVRFFRSPRLGPDLPWHAYDDLARALGLPREVRRELRQKRQKSWPSILKRIATPDGLVTIAPHYVAQGLLGAAAEARAIPARVESEYAMAGGEALKAITGDLPLADVIAFAAAAFRAEGGAS